MAEKKQTKKSSSEPKRKPPSHSRVPVPPKKNYSPLDPRNWPVEPGDNAKFLQNALEIYNLPKIDLFDESQVVKRIGEYFTIEAKNDNKPTVSGLAMALGVSREELWRIRTGRFPEERNGAQGGVAGLPKEIVNHIKKAYEILSRLWEDYMQNRKVDPMAGIFLGVNNYGMKNTKDVVIETAVDNSESRSESELIKSAGLLPSDTDGSEN